MLLSDLGIVAAISDGHLTIDPLGEDDVQPASIDVHVSNAFRVFRHHGVGVIDPRGSHDGLTDLVTVPEGQPFVLHPGQFALGCTVETITLDASIAARVEGKSSLGRVGLLTHSTAGWIDPGFGGQVTLELANVAPVAIEIWPGMEIAQLCIFRCSERALRPYGHPGLRSRYMDQRGPVAARPPRRPEPA